MIQYTKEYISRLLDKYMDGTSTLEEEDVLASYFRGRDVPQEWEDYRQMFQEIEAMKPQPETRRRWMGWSVAAAAAVAGVLYLAIPSQQAEQPQTKPLVAQADTIKESGGQVHDSFEKNHATCPPDSSLRKVDVRPVQSKKRRMRKTEPTIHDYAKAYALMAQAEQERMEAERQIEQAQQEIVEAQLAAYGYIPVMQEDGTIIYINEQTEFIAYEE